MLSGDRPDLGQPSGIRTKPACNWARSRGSSSAWRLLWSWAMSTTNRPAAMPAQSTPTLDHQHGAALGAARRGSDDGAASAGDQDLPLSTTIPIHRDALAPQLVRELVRGFHVGRGRV